ncbi:glycoside hydrolase family 27 protein [Cryobacterium algoritolerans]|uniref:Alpha-galactosidase n=1 Tax=Cryobacterium algoritolerans TaxID=1259184 RepID=A0A4R8WI69_9MICO|nr:glycoside hydrolase family 27 protein [Cryobacterium algoritolerans]TFC10421.1 glycoside hydrolase family 27 protein [Cryobacterium algoritolerans]
MRTTGALLLASIAAVGIAVLVVPAVTQSTPAAELTPVSAPARTLALTPPMGFNDWNSFGCDVSEELIKQTADYFVSSGMRDAGYRYVNIDDCWMARHRDADGRLTPDPDKFPSGIAGTADYVHSHGLKLGLYEDAGTRTCAGYPGSLGHEQLDAQTFAAWGVDYLKYDNCNNAGHKTPAQYIERYTTMADALAATGRPIVYSICEWGVHEPWTWAGNIGHLWRTTHDIKDIWSSLKSIIRRNAALSSHAGPGAWNDPDMLEIGNGGMTDAEYRTQFSLWAEMAAPLLVGTDLRRASPSTMTIYLNQDVIDVDQDPLGKQGRLVSTDHDRLVFAKPLSNGDVAVALFNGSDTTATISTSAAQAGLGAARNGYLLRDLWSRATILTTGDITATVAPHATVMYRISSTRFGT